MSFISLTQACAGGRAKASVLPPRRELTLTEALSDPLVRTVMAADGVDPRELAVAMSAMAQVINGNPATRL